MIERQMNKADLYTSIVLLIFSATILIMALQMPTMVDRNESPWSGPGVVPAFIGIALFLLAAFMFARSIMRGALKKNEDEQAASKAADVARPDIPTEQNSLWKRLGANTSNVRILKTVLICILYVISLGKIWFPLATFLFVLVFIIVFEFDKHKTILSQWKIFFGGAIIAASTSALITIAFQYLFLVNLP